MEDRLVWLLDYFELRARVFKVGPLCNVARFDAADGLGYIHVVEGGLLEVETKGQPTLLIQEPSLVFYMNPTDHHLRPRGEAGAAMVCASFEFGAGLRNPLAQALPDVLAIRLRDMPALALTLEILFQEAAQQHCGRQAVLDRLMEVVVIQLLRDLMDQKRLELGLLAGLADARLAKAINAMHADPGQSWSLEALAAVAGMSRARFAVRFRETVGLTPMAYLGEWRLGVAQSLLLRGKPVQLVAHAVGYGSASALSRAFAAQTGCSPTEWVRAHAQGPQLTAGAGSG